MKSQAEQTLQNLIVTRYSEAQAIFWCGSIAHDGGNNKSDLDIIVIFESLPTAFRETYLYQDWQIDAFIHDPETLYYFFNENLESGMPAMLKMVHHGKLLTQPNATANRLKQLASDLLSQGPKPWSDDTIQRERFLITDMLEDIEHPLSREKQIASSIRLYQSLADFYFRTRNKWTCNNKVIVDYLLEDSPAYAKQFTKAFESLYSQQQTTLLAKLVADTLAPYGGLLWLNYYSEAGGQCKKALPDE